jgi:hypothetical protein
LSILVHFCLTKVKICLFYPPRSLTAAITSWKRQSEVTTRWSKRGKPTKLETSFSGFTLKHFTFNASHFTLLLGRAWGGVGGGDGVGGLRYLFPCRNYIC